MREIAVDFLLGIAVAAAWIAALGFARLRWSLDRLHVASFVTIGCGVPFIVAAFVADGASTRALKLLLAWLVLLVAGASVNQAIARAIFNRKEAGEQS